MSSIKLPHSSGNAVSIAAPQSNPAADRTIYLNDNYAGDGSFVTANSSGKVGIGTGSPTVNVQVQSSGTNSLLKLAGTSAGSGINDGLDVGINGVDAILWNRENGTTQFATNNTERIRVNSAGDIWINQTTNGGWGSTGAGVVHIRGNDTSNGLLRINDTGGSSDQAFIRFQYNDHGNNCGGIRRNGTGTDPEFFTGSDRRIKTNIADIPNVLDKINQVKIKTWELKSDSNTKGISPIAQDLATIFPDKVTKTDDGTGDTVPDGVEPWSIGLNYTWELMKAVQELSAKVETLETKVAALEGS